MRRPLLARGVSEAEHSRSRASRWSTGLMAVAEVSLARSHPAEPWTFVHFGLLGAALAMLGPGGCSVDARLFGRKHIQIPQR